MNEKKMNITEGKVSKDLGEAISFLFMRKELHTTKSHTIVLSFILIKELHEKATTAILFILTTARRSNQPILKEISPGCSLEGMMLKLKLQYFGHLIRRVDSLEKTLMLGGIGSYLS